MSYSGDEPLEYVIGELKAKLPELQRMLDDGVHAATLLGTVEMLSVLVGKYEAGLIAESGEGVVAPDDAAACWDGITRPETLTAEGASVRHEIADAGKRSNWPRLLALLSEHRTLVNTVRPGGAALYAPLHHAAYGGAPAEVVERLLELGAWRTLQNARGERPSDVAHRRGHDRLTRVLEPELKRRVPVGVLRVIQAHFHDVIRERAAELVKEHALRLPELEPLLEMDQKEVWFAIPGMYGGFNFRLAEEGVEAKLVALSWCRVVEGSGQRHEITSSGSKLVAEGFV